jgi:hypothetical protein
VCTLPLVSNCVGFRVNVCTLPLVSKGARMACLTCPDNHTDEWKDIHAGILLVPPFAEPNPVERFVPCFTFGHVRQVIGAWGTGLVFDGLPHGVTRAQGSCRKS